MNYISAIGIFPRRAPFFYRAGEQDKSFLILVKSSALSPNTGNTGETQAKHRLHLWELLLNGINYRRKLPWNSRIPSPWCSKIGLEFLDYPQHRQHRQNTGDTCGIVLKRDKLSPKAPFELENSFPRVLQNWPETPGLTPNTGNTGGTQAKHR